MQFDFFKKQTKSAIGVEITPEGITAVSLGVKKKALYLKSYAFEPFVEETIQNGLIINDDSFINAFRAIQKRETFDTNQVNIALPSNVTLIKTISLPYFSEDELALIIPNEAPKHIPYSLDEVNYDFEILHNRVRQEGPIQKVDVVLVAVHKTAIKNYVEVFEKLNMEIARVEIFPFAMIRTLANANLIDESDSYDICLSVGHENTDINIVNKGMPLFSNNYNVGKKNIIESLEHSLNISVEEIHKLLPEIALIIPGMNLDEMDPKLNKAAAAVRTIYNNMCNEIQKTIEFYNSQMTEPVKIRKIIIGGVGVCTQNIDKYIVNRLKIETELCKSLDNISNNVDFSDNLIYPVNIPALSTSVGLALKGMQN